MGATHKKIPKPDTRARSDISTVNRLLDEINDTSDDKNAKSKQNNQKSTRNEKRRQSKKDENGGRKKSSSQSASKEKEIVQKPVEVEIKLLDIPQEEVQTEQGRTEGPPKKIAKAKTPEQTSVSPVDLSSITISPDKNQSTALTISHGPIWLQIIEAIRYSFLDEISSQEQNPFRSDAISFSVKWRTYVKSGADNVMKQTEASEEFQLITTVESIKHHRQTNHLILTGKIQNPIGPRRNEEVSIFYRLDSRTGAILSLTDNSNTQNFYIPEDIGY